VQPSKKNTGSAAQHTPTSDWFFERDLFQLVQGIPRKRLEVGRSNSVEAQQHDVRHVSTIIEAFAANSLG
jgi:hypothetical protein